MLCTDLAGGAAHPGLALATAADLQDHLMVASNDLERLQRLLDDASQALMSHFTGALSHIEEALGHIAAAERELVAGQPGAMAEAKQTLGGAITALQFQDMATQLIAHTTKRLRNCADRLASDAMGSDDEGEAAYVEEMPMRPNPVTQDEMDAGSIELF